MLDEQIVKDITEIHARLLDHRPILQGHINFFVREFEEKRGDRENERLNTILHEMNEMKDIQIPETIDAMQVYVANVTAKLKVATEVCRKIEEKENSVDLPFLEEMREKRKQDWEEYMKGQMERCEKIDHEFEEQVKTLHKHYNDLEDKLCQTTNLAAP